MIDQQVLQRVLDRHPGVGRAGVVDPNGQRLVAMAGGRSAHERRNVFSVTKSVVALIYGIAFDEGLAPSPETRVVDALPYDLAGGGDVTIDDLFRMRAGFPSDPTDGTMPSFTGGRSWAATAATEVRSAAGEFRYSSASSQLIAAILSGSLREPLRRYASRRLFEPLGFGPVRDALVPFDAIDSADQFADVVWGTDPRGEPAGWSYLCLSLMDLLALGQLVRDGGQVDGRTLVPAAWIGWLLSDPVAVPDLYDRPLAWRYSRQWWTTDRDDVRRSVALGYSGQRIVVLPESGFVIACVTDVPEAEGIVAAESAADAMTDELAKELSSR